MDRMKVLEHKLYNISELSTLPSVAHTVIQITKNPKSSALEVGKAISQDQAISSKVLKMVNSAYYGFPRKITTITHAIVILGFANIRNLVLTASILEMFFKKNEGDYFDHEEFWKHSLACGVTSNLLAKRIGIKNTEEAFIWGLLHDIGKLVIDKYFHNEFLEIINLVNEKNIQISKAEKEVLGLEHTEVGAMVADKWNLPPALIKAIRYHHDPQSANELARVASIVHLADILCRAIELGNGGDNQIPEVDEKAWKILSLNESVMKILFRQMEREVKSASSFLPFAI